MAGSTGDQGNNNGSFFLDADDAKSLGNAEFMRKSKSIRRTFPKTVNGEELELIQEVSSLEAKIYRQEAGETKLASSSKSVGSNLGSMNETESTLDQSASKEADSRRSNDTSLDLFRSMAKDIRR